MLKITMLGTSATMPLPDRALTSVFADFMGHSILFDCGEGTQSAARRQSVSLFKTEIIALTHYHGDHIFGLPGLLQTFGCLGRTEPLIITGPDGLEDSIIPILKIAGDLPFEVDLCHLPCDGVKLSDWIGNGLETVKLIPIPTQHRTKSQGYKLELSRPAKFLPDKATALGVPQILWGKLQKGDTVEVDGRIIEPYDVTGEARNGISVVFSGDTSPCRELEDAATGCDLFISEATYGEEDQEMLAYERGHSTIWNAVETAQRANPRELWLTHFSQTITDLAEYDEKVAERFPSGILCRDGQTKILDFPKR